MNNISVPDQDHGSVLDMVVTGHTQTLDVYLSTLVTWESVPSCMVCGNDSLAKSQVANEAR